MAQFEVVAVLVLPFVSAASVFESEQLDLHVGFGLVVHSLEVVVVRAFAAAGEEPSLG